MNRSRSISRWLSSALHCPLPDIVPAPVGSVDHLITPCLFAQLTHCLLLTIAVCVQLEAQAVALFSRIDTDGKYDNLTVLSLAPCALH